MADVNVSTVRQANAWLKKMGVGNRVIIISKNDKTYGKIYQVIENLSNGSRSVIYQAVDINLCLDAVYNLILSRK